MNNLKHYPIGKSGNKSVLKSVRFTPDEYQIVEERTAESGYKNISEYIVKQSTQSTTNISDCKYIGLLQRFDYLINQTRNGEISKGECINLIEEEVNYLWHTYK